MTQVRLIICFYIFILPSLFCGLFGLEIWPFSNYPMYSKPAERESNKMYRIYILDKYGKETELPLSLLIPLDKRLLREKLKSYKYSTNEKEKVHKLLEFYASKVKYASNSQNLEDAEKLQLRLLFGQHELNNTSSNFQINSFKIVDEAQVN